MEEHGDKANLNTPGGAELYEKLGGGSGGVPFHAFLDTGGDMIVNSMRPTENGKFDNIGHPDAPEEVDWFLVMVHRAAPQITSDEAGVLEHWLRNQKK